MNKSYGKKGLTSLFDLSDSFKEKTSNLSSISSVKDIGSEYETEFTLKGFSKGDISVYVENQDLVISAANKLKKFDQRFLMPRDASSNIKASFRGDTLNVIIPKHKTKQAVKYIPIN